MRRVVPVTLAALALCAQAWAQTDRLDEMLAADPRLDLERLNSKNLTPSERIRINALRARLYPDLRGRWDPAYRLPASRVSVPVDNLAQSILESFRTDPELSDIAVWLKVSADEGDVVLEGYAPDPEQRQLIGRRVEQMDGVRSVENRLRVGRPEGTDGE